MEDSRCFAREYVQLYFAFLFLSLAVNAPRLLNVIATTSTASRMTRVGVDHWKNATTRSSMSRGGGDGMGHDVLSVAATAGEVWQILPMPTV